MVDAADPRAAVPRADPRRVAACQAAEILGLSLTRGLRRSAGNVAGNNTGSSLDFQDHRPYAPGDDPRHIDWRAYTRTGHYTMKLFRDELRPYADICLDVSASMRISDAKADRALELALFCVESARRAGAAASLIEIDGSRVRALGPEAVFAWPEESKTAAAPAAGARMPEIERVRFRAGSVRVFVSDLLFAGAPEPLLHALLAANGRPIVLAPFCAEESNPDWLGSAELVDSESTESRTLHFSEAELRRYRTAYASHFKLWSLGARKAGASLARVPAEPPLIEALKFEALAAGAVELV